MKFSIALIAAATTLFGLAAAAPNPQAARATFTKCVNDMVEDSEGTVNLELARCICGNGGRACFDEGRFDGDFGGTIQENTKANRVIPQPVAVAVEPVSI